MACESPRVIKVNGMLVTVPCSACFECKRKRALDWLFRLYQEWSYSDGAYFITLTLEDEFTKVNENGELEVCKKDVQLFNKRLREEIRKYDKSIKYRYYSVSEYCPTTDRPHYHIIGFNIPEQVADKVSRIWNRGFVTIDRLLMERIAYTSGYIMKNHDKDYSMKEKPFALMSTKPAIGSKWLEENKSYLSQNSMENVTLKGKKFALPRYYREKVFTKMSRQIKAIKNQEQADRVYNNFDNYLAKFGNPSTLRIRKKECEKSKFLKKQNKKSL